MKNWNRNGHECATLLFHVLCLKFQKTSHNAKVAEHSVYGHNMRVIIEIVLVFFYYCVNNISAQIQAQLVFFL